jgi:ABC-2 type transport system ATP-binding protein
MLCGIVEPTSGSGLVNGLDILTQQEQIKQSIGYMSQRFSLYEDLSVEENINFFAGIYRLSAAKKKERKEWVIKMAGLKDLRGSLTGILSVGWKQRLALGCAIIHEPEILFLDEPTSGVDPISRGNFWQLIKEMARRGVTVFVTTHYMDEAENCDRLALIFQGDIIALGTPEELKTRDMKKDVLQINLPQPEDWIESLSKVPGIRETALFGTSLHAVVDNAAAASGKLKSLFASRGLKDYSLRQIVPSLEDVFVALIEAHSRPEAVPK